MLKINKIVAVSLFVIVPLTILAQNNTNSPYTRFGYGELADRSFGAGRSMGGIGYGLRSNKQINPMNPASYTSTDSLTFLFDFGLAGQLSWFDDGVNKEKHTNGNLEYIAMQFPVHRRVSVSAGILPYSYVGYNFASQETSEQGISYSERFVGSGGLNEIYAGVSVDIWKKRLSLGANVGYMFGKIAHTQSLLIDGTGANSSSRTQNLRVNDIKLDLGLQYTHPVSAKESYTFGLVFSPGKKLNSSSTNIATSGSAITGQDTTNQAFDIPNSFGAGISYVKQNKLTLAADILYENWANARFFDKKGNLKNRIRVAAGGEYIPNYQNRAFFSRIKYRAGVHYSNSYLNVNESSYNEMGASIGLGLPLIDQRSYLNLSFEYVKIKPESRMLIDEQYLRFTVNYTFNERWFFKFKVN